MNKIQIIIGSTRTGRVGRQVGEWIYDVAKQRPDLEFELVDLADWPLPFLDEPMPPSMGQPYTQEHTKKWSAKVLEADGYIFVTPEYNHGYSAVLKNALDYLNKEWNHKPVAFVSYGSAGGARAVEQLRQVVAELRMTQIRDQVMIRFTRENYKDGKFTDLPDYVDSTKPMLDQLAFWTEALKVDRAELAAKA